MEFGSLAEWAAVVAAFIAGIFAFTAWRSAQSQARSASDQLNIELNREEERHSFETRQQTSLISVWGVMDTSDPNTKYGFHFENSSTASVYNVEVDAGKLDGDKLAPIILRQLPPGSYEVPRRGKDPVRSITFVDAQGHRWKRDGSWTLTQLKDAPAPASVPARTTK